MGCSPSKGQLFAVPAHKALKPGSQESNHDVLSNGTEIQSNTETDIVSAVLTIVEDEDTPQGNGPSLCDDVVGDIRPVISEAVESNGNSREGLDKACRKDERKKKNKGAKRNRQKEKTRKTVQFQSKVDLPEKTVKAHQAAYAYLHPSIPKYESLMGVLDRATKTQLSLQPIVAMLALRYEEINQALEEMAVEGEQMLEEHGTHMAWPAAIKDVLFDPSKPDRDGYSVASNTVAELYSPEPSPDLLQQMLQHSSEKLRLIGDSVNGLGDAALDEAVAFFASLSQVLREKQVVKRAAEGRLKQVLDRVEAAILRKSCLEDSALHSEDSGIGGDNECQNGSVRLRRHREGSGSGASTGSSTGPENTLHAQSHLNGVLEDRNDDGNEDEEDDDDDDDGDSSEDEEEAKDESGKSRKMSDFTFKYPHHAGLQNSNSAHVGRRATSNRRPQTADTQTSQGNSKPSHLRGLQRSQSAGCLYLKEDDNDIKEKKQKDSQKSACRRKGLAGDVALGGLCRTRLRSNSSEGQNTARCYGLQYGSKGPFKATLRPSSPAEFVPAPPGRNAVKRLINTFSQGAQDSSSQKLANRPMKVRGTKKGFLPQLSNSKGGVSTNGNNNNNSFSDRPEEVDVDSLPPPPPEVLMDNSFESNEAPPGYEDGIETSTQRQRRSVSQRLRTSLQTVTVLPSRATIPRRSQSISPARPIRQDAVVGSRQGLDCEQTAKTEEAASLYQRSRKIIHLRHATDSPVKTGPGDQGIIRSGSVVKQESRESVDNEALTPYPNSYPPTTPPVSRARLPPSCPSVRHRVPSPPALPPPACGQWGASARPSSPSVQRWTRRSSYEENGTTSLSFIDARSVFCQETQAAHQALTPSCMSTLPRPWGEPSRGRPHLPQTFMKSGSSGARPTFADQQEPLPSATQSHGQDIERAESSDVSRDACGGTDPQGSRGVTEAQEGESRQITDNQD